MTARRINEGGTTRGWRSCKHKRHHEHGTPARYEQDGCRCVKCADAKSADGATERELKAYGRWQDDHGLISAEPVRQHLIKLAATGVGPVQVGRLAGINWQTAERIHLGKGKTVQKRTAKAIMAIPVGTNPSPLKQVSGVGMRRRIRALCAIGWTVAWQAKRMGIARNQLEHTLEGGGALAWKDQLVRELYDELRDTPPTPTTPQEKSHMAGCIARARRLGWAPPIAWDDDSIDNPDAKPDPGWAPRPTAGRGKTVDWSAVAEDLEFLRKADVIPEEAAKRLGYTQDYLQYKMQKLGYANLSWWVSKKRRREAS